MNCNEDLFYIDPARAIHEAAKQLLNKDSGPAKLLPYGWLNALKIELLNAKEHVAIYGGQESYWLAFLAHNRMVRQYTSPIKSAGEFAKFR